MKKKYLAVLFLALFFIPQTFSLPDPIHESVAVADSAAGGFVNPAALSFGTGTGLGFFSDFAGDEFNGDFTAYFFTRVLGYAIDRTDDTFRHNFTFSTPLFNNLYIGTALTTESFQDNNTSWDFGLLYRPADYLSLGTRAILPPRGDARYVSGIALRPLYFYGIDTKRLSLFTDFSWNFDGAQAPRVGVHIEPFDGLNIKAAYDVENEGLGFSFSFAVGAVRGGTFVQTAGANDSAEGSVFLQFSPRPFNYPYATTSDVFYNYSFGPRVVETGQAIRTGPFYFVMDHNSVLDTLEELKQIEKTPYIDGLVFINAHSSMSLSTLIELRDALNKVRENGKKILFYSDYMDSMDYLLAASVADEIYLHPQGMIDLKGVSVSSPYFSDFFKKYGVEVANFNTGKYKSVYNFLSEPSMPPAEKEALEFMLEGLVEEYARLIGEGRGDLLKGDVRKIIENGPYMIAEEALQAGLVDGLVHRDELKEKASFLSDRSIVKTDLPTRLVRTDWSDPLATRVAVIHADGPIHTGSGVPGMSIGSDSLSRAIRIAREDNRVKAILLRVNSGGGSSLASDLIAREVELCRTGEDAKPIVVSMAGMAASGGYYLSAFADRIVASPAALTGSIGVIAIYPNFAGLLDQYQVNWDVVRKGPRADFGSMYRRLTEDEKSRIRTSIAHSYDRFLQVVSEGRDMPVEDVKKVAGGRVWTGRQAVERGLVDEIGGYKTAFDALIDVADISGEVELVDYSFVDTWGIISLGRLPGMFLKKMFAGGPDVGSGSGLSGAGLSGAGPDFASGSELDTLIPPELVHLWTYYRAVGGEDSPALLVMPYYVEGVSEGP